MAVKTSLNGTTPPHAEPFLHPGGGSAGEAIELAYNPANGINPLVWAANPLLDMIPQILALTHVDDPSGMFDKLVAEIRAFEKRTSTFDITREDLIGARYCLCAVLDEAVSRTPWGGLGTWASQSLLMTFHKEADGREKYYRLLSRLVQTPETHTDLIELLYYCNELGFEGMFRDVDDGATQLAALKQRIAQTLRDVKGDCGKRLAIHWRGVNSTQPPPWRLIPPWVAVALSAVVGLVSYLLFLLAINTHSDDSFKRVTSLEVSPATASVETRTR
jgi:type VI secretion system protein ImpK